MSILMLFLVFSRQNRQRSDTYFLRPILGLPSQNRQTSVVLPSGFDPLGPETEGGGGGHVREKKNCSKKPSLGTPSNALVTKNDQGVS